MTNTEHLTDTAAYLHTITTACQTNGWARLATIRMESGLTRDAADAALLELHRAGCLRLEQYPVAFQVTNADAAAALHLGGIDRHIATTTHL